jgi:hypothetical protein
MQKTLWTVRSKKTHWEFFAPTTLVRAAKFLHMVGKGLFELHKKTEVVNDRN